MQLTAERRADRSRLANVTSTIRLVTKRLGWTHALLWLCAALGGRFGVHIFVVRVHRIDDERTSTSVDTGGLDARLLTRDEIVRFFDRDGDDSYSRAFATGALSRGDRCFGVLEDGRLLWYCWYACGPAPIFDDVDAVADVPFLYAYNAHTDRAHRGRGLHRIGVRASARVFAREGYRAFTAYIETNNLAPLIAARTMGEPLVGLVALHRAAGRVRWVASPGCRNGGFRLQRRTPDVCLRRSPDKDGRAPA